MQKLRSRTHRHQSTRLCLTVFSIASFTVGVVTFADEIPATVRTGQLTRSQVGAERVFVGTVEAARRAIVGSPVAGRIELVNIEEGDAVTATGDEAGVLIQLEPDAANIALSAAEASADVARHELADRVAGPRPEEVRRLEADVRRTSALLTLSRKSLTRIESLLERSAVGQSEMDAAVTANEAAEEASRVASAYLEEAQAGARKELLEQSRARLALAEQEVLRMLDLKKKHSIRAPFGGYVVKRHVEQGTWVQQGDPVIEIAELNPVEVRIAVPEESITQVTQGMPVRIDVGATRTADPESALLFGSVYRIIPDADERTRSFPVRIRIDNPQSGELPLLKPGMLARVHLPVGEGVDSILAPRDALVLDDLRISIFVVEDTDGDTVVREIAVKAGSAHGSLIQVRPVDNIPLTAGTQVVVEGNESLATGQVVSVLDSQLSALRQSGP